MQLFGEIAMKIFGLLVRTGSTLYRGAKFKYTKVCNYLGFYLSYIVQNFRFKTRNIGNKNMMWFLVPKFGPDFPNTVFRKSHITDLSLIQREFETEYSYKFCNWNLLNFGGGPTSNIAENSKWACISVSMWTRKF